MFKKSSGFTLIELVLVVAIVAILAAAVYVALNPARRLSEANNSQRWSDVTAVLNAVIAYTVDNDGNLPSGIDSDYSRSQVLGTSNAGCNQPANCSAASTEAACLDLSEDLVDNGYISEIPFDPNTGSSVNTDYYIQLDENGIITVGACDPQAEGATTPTIRVQR